MSNTESSINHGASKSSAVVKEHFSISTFNREYDLHCFISQTAKVRKLQKKYYAAQDKQIKHDLLIQCKREESTLDRLGNTLWIKYKLGDIPYHPLYRLG